MKTINKGFSLIELLVSITIGAIILTVVMGSYAAMVKTSLQLDVARKMQKEINFAAIRIADKVRNFSFDLDSSNSTKLIIPNEKGVFTFLKNQGKLNMDGQPLFSSNILVEDVKFDYSGDPAKIQPRVKIYLKISSKSHPQITNWIQTTISSRVFN